METLLTEKDLRLGKVFQQESVRPGFAAGGTVVHEQHHLAVEGHQGHQLPGDRGETGNLPVHQLGLLLTGKHEGFVGMGALGQRPLHPG